MSSATSDRSSASPGYWLRLILAACILYAAAVVPRVWETADQEVQADEIHWQSRSYTLLKALNPPGISGASGRRAHFSDHLGHPGVPPALVMAAGEYVADSLNHAEELEFGQDGYIDHLAASRLANVLVSSLVVPLVFALGTLVLGALPAGFAAALLIFDPIHIGLSRMAHLDSMLTLFVTAALLLFALAEKRSSLVLHVSAGLAWGLAIASKPTAAALVLGFLMYRVLSPMIAQFSRQSAKPRFLWRDVWAVILGQVVLACLFTRLWIHPSQYLGRLKVESALADVFYHGGLSLQGLFAPSYLLPSVFVLIAFGLSVVAVRKRSGLLFHLAMVGIIGALIVAVVGFAPPILENLIRFWGWVAGLSHEVHLAYGKTIEPPEYGYAAILLKRLPVVLLLGLPAALVMWRPWQRTEFSDSSCAKAFVMLGVSVSLCWMVMLSISDKQTIRYLIPIFPALYLVAALGIVQIFQGLATRFPVQKLKASPLSVALALTVSLHAGASFGWHPAYLLYHNSLTGGLAGALAHGEELPFVGQREVLQHLHEKAKAEGTSYRVRVVGDVNTFRYTYRRLYPGQEKLLHFPLDRGPSWGYFVLDFPAFQKNYPNRWRSEIAQQQGQLEYSYSVAGQPLANLYRLPLVDLSEPVVFGVEKFTRRTGVLVKGANGENQIEVTSKSKRDFLATGLLVMVEPGEYSMEPLIRLTESDNESDVSRPKAPVVTVSTNSVCERKIYTDELSRAQSEPAVLICSIKEARVIRLNVFWLGKVPLRFSGVRLQKRSEPTF